MYAHIYTCMHIDSILSRHLRDGLLQPGHSLNVACVKWRIEIFEGSYMHIYTCIHREIMLSRHLRDGLLEPGHSLNVSLGKMAHRRFRGQIYMLIYIHVCI